MQKQIKESLDKATPGPWEVMNTRDIFTPRGSSNREGIMADTNDGWHIAEISFGTTFVGGEEHEMKMDERQANAYLIANAPTWLAHQQSIISKQEKELAMLKEDRYNLSKLAEERFWAIERLKKQFEDYKDQLRAEIKGESPC